MAIASQKKVPLIDPRYEYLSAGVLSSFFGTALINSDGNQTLFVTNDDVLMQHGYDVYECMLKDAKVSKCINTLKTFATADGVEILPCFSENHPEYNQAVKVKELCEAAINNLDYKLKYTLEEMLDALSYGYKIAEVVYEVKDLDIGTYLIPKYIKPKPFGSAKFIVDNKYNVLGIAGTSNFNLKNNGIGFLPIDSIQEIDNTLIGKSNNDIYKFLNREKFMVLSLRPRNGDPRGTSFLRAAFEPWYLKRQVYPEYLRYLLICAIPLLVGFTPEEETIASDIVRDNSGNAVIGVDGQPVRFNPVAALRGALLEARNATALALKGGSDIKEIGNNGNNGTAFYKAIEVFNEEIEAAILLQTLASSESRFSTRAQSQTHMSVLDQLVFWLKGVLADMIQKDLLIPVIKYNLGESWLKYMPVVSLGDTERRNFAQDAEAVSKLMTSEFLTEEQLKHIDSLLQLPIRESGAKRIIKEKPAGTPSS